MLAIFWNILQYLSSFCNILHYLSSFFLLACWPLPICCNLKERRKRKNNKLKTTTKPRKPPPPPPKKKKQEHKKKTSKPRRPTGSECLWHRLVFFVFLFFFGFLSFVVFFVFSWFAFLVSPQLTTFFKNKQEYKEAFGTLTCSYWGFVAFVVIWRNKASCHRGIHGITRYELEKRKQLRMKQRDVLTGIHMVWNQAFDLFLPTWKWRDNRAYCCCRSTAAQTQHFVSHSSFKLQSTCFLFLPWWWSWARFITSAFLVSILD